MKKRITIKELREQLEGMEAMGYGDAELVYMDEESFTYGLEEGVHDVWNGMNIVVLG
jgi:hypothetical protein